MTRWLSEPPPEIPARFWRTVDRDGWRGIFDRGGWLDAEQCARLWRMTDRQGEPPQALEVLFNRADALRWIASLKKRKC